MFFLILSLFSFQVNLLRSDVVDQLVDYRFNDVQQGTLSVIRKGSQEIDPWQDSPTQETTVEVIEGFSFTPSGFLFDIDVPILKTIPTTIAQERYYLVNLTTQDDYNIVLYSLDFGEISLYTADVACPTHLFVADFNNDQKQDLLIGKVVGGAFEYQIAYNTTQYPIPDPRNEVARYVQPTFDFTAVDVLSGVSTIQKAFLMSESGHSYLFLGGLQGTIIYMYLSEGA